MFDKIMRAVKLDVTLYEEVEADKSQTQPALMIVGAVAVISMLSAMMSGHAGLGAAIGAGIWSFVGFLLWAVVVNFIGTRLFKGTSDTGEVIRTLGFAYSPLLLGAFQFIPLLGPLLLLAALIWVLVAMVVAVRQSMDFTTGKAVATIVIGFIPYALGMALIGAVFG